MQLPHHLKKRRSKNKNNFFKRDPVESTLALLVARITTANHTHHPVTPHYLAVAANFLYGCLNFHLLLL